MSDPKPTKAKLNLSLPVETIRRLKLHATMTNRTVSDVIDELVQDNRDRLFHSDAEIAVALSKALSR